LPAGVVVLGDRLFHRGVLVKLGGFPVALSGVLVGLCAAVAGEDRRLFVGRRRSQV
jgi:hypothetical protein